METAEKAGPVPKDFGWALQQARAGKKVCRLHWRDCYLMLQKPDHYSKMGHPYLYMKGADGKNRPWWASNEDLLALNWDEFHD